MSLVGSITTPCTRNITIEKNTIKNCGASGIFVNAADGICICENRLYRTNQQSFSQAPDKAIKAEYSIDVQNSLHSGIAGNVVKQPGKYCAGIYRKLKKY
jgi:hypothetical protein